MTRRFYNICLCVQNSLTLYPPQKICEHFALGLYHTPPGAMDFLKYPCTVDGRAFVQATGFQPLFTLEDIFASVRH